jgi:hypothetical protein
MAWWPLAQVTEEARIDLTQGRVEGEEYLREHGAVCLVLAGIYGDERQPSSWLLRGTLALMGWALLCSH